MSKINNLFVFILALYALLWGTAWNVKYLNLSITEFFIPLILSYSLYKNFYQRKPILNFYQLLIFLIITSFIIIYLIIGMIRINELSNSVNDIYYAIFYSIKLIIFFYFGFVVANILDNKKNIEKFIKYFFLMLIPLYVFLHYRYAFIYETYHVGVSLDGEGLKNGKNSFAAIIALLAPFIISRLFDKNNRSLFLVSSFIVILLCSYFLYSRAMTIVLIVEIFLIILLIEGRFKKILIFLLLLISLFITFKNFEDDILKYFLKSDYDTFQETSELALDFNEVSQTKKEYILFDTHRGWLLYEALEGVKQSHYIGNGIGTFRVRVTNEGSKTETHNDLALIFYETGIVGFSLLLITIFSLIVRTYNLFLNKKDYLYRGMFAALWGLIFSMLFSNFINTFMFWIVIGIYLSLINDKEENLKAKK